MMFCGVLFRQEIIFGYLRSHTDLSCLSYHVDFLGTMKPVIFQDDISSSLFVPCLTCDPLRFSKVMTLSLRGIRQSWDAQNNDIHKYLAFQQDPVEGKCELLQDGLAKVTTFDFCPMVIISERYNLTILGATAHEVEEFMKLNNSQFIKSFGNSFAVQLSYSSDLLFTFFQPHFRSIDFFTITNPPSAASRIGTFVLPFDLEI